MRAALRLAGSLALAVLSACVGPAPPAPPTDLQPVPDCSFVSLDFTGYSTWGSGCRLQVRADGAALVEGFFEDEKRSSDKAPDPCRVGRLSEAQLAELCRLVPSDPATWRERYVQSGLFDGPAMLIVLRTSQSERHVFEYGRTGPASLHELQQALDDLVRSVTWQRWNGDEAAWLAATGWTPRATWQRDVEREFPPYPD